MMGFGLLFPVLVVGAIAALAGWRPFAPQSPPPAEKRGSALDILRERYARGEITQEQFREMKEVLSESGESAGQSGQR